MPPGDNPLAGDDATMPPGVVAAVIPAAGSGRRFGPATDKLWASLAGKPVWRHGVERLACRPEVGRVVMAVSVATRGRLRRDAAETLNRLRVELVLGGEERTDSVRAAVDAVAGDPAIRYVAIHDAARPLVRDEDLAAVFAAAAAVGAAILATPMVGTVKRAGGGDRIETVDRDRLWVAQTPQVFRIDWLLDAYRRHRGRPATDDAQLLERCGLPVRLVPGHADNLKITHPEDLAVAEAFVARLAAASRGSHGPD